jgi:serine/threonine protein kinase
MSESDSAGWAAAKQIFDQVVELLPAERSGRLAALCGSDVALRTEVESLLRAHHQATGFLEEPVTAAAEVPQDAVLGPYRFVRELGRGGMGTVYLAERADGAFEQRVAIKVVRRGLDTEAVLRRFLAERQILASLDHPGIARLLDGGSTPDGLPYFVMEVIDGEPLDVYSDARRLPAEERIRLFLRVCDAVAHAHRRLVLHRDLKPGNILVDGQGDPKLLDFGIAKLLSPDRMTESTELTHLGSRPMTPEYASPEQIRGEALTTTSDVYSLGVVLYRLLTGEGPYRLTTGSTAEVSRAVLEQEPARPSTRDAAQPEPRDARRRWRTDLDHVVLKALAKETAHRYGSVDAFADDLRRYLEGRPVLAHPLSLGYRATKFVRRHRAAVAAAALAGLTLVAGVAATLWQARRAERQRALAERRFEEVRSLAKTFIFEVNDGIEHLAGSTPVREKIVATALAYLDRLAAEDSSDAGLRLELAQGYRRIGDVQGNPFMPNLGKLDGARESYEKSLRLARGLVAASPNELEARTALWGALQRLAYLDAETRGVEAEGKWLAEALAVVEASVAAHPDAPGPRRQVQQTLTQMAQHAFRRGGNAEAVQLQRRCLSQAEGFRASFPADADAERDIVVAQLHLVDGLRSTAQLEEAERLAQAALQKAEALAREQTDNAQALRDVGVALERLCEVMADRGKDREAMPFLRRIVAIDERRLTQDPRNTQALRDVAAANEQLAKGLAALGENDEALASFARAEEALRQLLGLEPGLAAARVDLAGIVSRRAETEFAMGGVARAAAAQSEAIRHLERAAAEDAENRAVQYDLAVMRATLGEWQLQAGRAREAEPLARQAVESFAAYRVAVPEDSGGRLGSAVSLTLLGEIEWRTGRRQASCASFGAAEKHWTEFAAGKPLAGELETEHEKTLTGIRRCKG